MEYLGAIKNLKSKISCQTPFKRLQLFTQYVIRKWRGQSNGNSSYKPTKSYQKDPSELVDWGGFFVEGRGVFEIVNMTEHKTSHQKSTFHSLCYITLI